MQTEADVKLLFGADEGSLGKITEDIRKMLESIPDDTFRVKIGVDLSEANTAIENFKKQISELSKQVFSSGSPGTVTSDTKPSSKIDSQSFEKIKKDVHEFNNELKNTEANLNAIKGAIAEIKVTNSAITSSYKKITSDLGGGAATGQNAEDLSALKAKYTELMAAVSDLNSKKTQATQEDISMVRSLQSEMDRLIAKVRERLNAEHDAENAAKDSAKEAENAARREQNATKARAAAAKRAAEQEISSLKRAITLLTQHTEAEEKFTAAKHGKSSGEYNKISENRQELELLIESYRNGRISQEDFDKKLQELSVSFKENSRVIKENRENTKTFGERIGGLVKKFGTWFSITRVIMAIVREIKQMIKASIELESAFAQLKIVTGATEAEMEKFANTSVRLAKDLGKSVTEITKSIETFSRLGYNLADAAKLAEYATILSNVAAVDTNEATTGLTSIIKGYNLNVEEAAHVADVLVSVGQKYAVSASEMMEAYEKSGAALNATNTSFEKSAGLIAAANASVQNASTVGTALKTVSARIRGSKSDLEELGEDVEELANGFSKYAEEIKALTGFNIMLDEKAGTFKDIYDIFSGIASVWNKLSDTQQSRVSEILGGTRQLQVISSIIGNWEDAVNAYGTAMDSAGEATRANNIYMETTAAHIEQMKAAFQELSKNFIDSDFVKSVVDFLTGIIESANGLARVINMLGGLRSLLASIAGILVIIKAKSISNFLKSIPTLLSKLLTPAKRVADVLASFRSGTALAVQDTSRFSAALKGLNITASTAEIAISALAAVITIAIVAFSAYKNHLEKVAQQNKDAAQTAGELSNEIIDLTDKYLSLSEAVKTDASAKEELLSVQDDLIDKLDIEKDRLDELIKTYGNYSDAIKAASAEKLKEQERDLRGALPDYENDVIKGAKRGFFDTSGYKKDLLSPGNGYIVLSGNESGKGSTELYTALRALQDKGYISRDSYGVFESNGKNYSQGFNFALELNDEVSQVDALIEMYEQLGDMLDIVQDKAGSNNALYDSLYEQYNAMKSSVDAYKGSIKNLNDNLTEQYMLNALIGKEIPSTEEEFNSFKNTLIDSAKENGEFVGSEKDIENSIERVLKKQPEFKKFFKDTNDGILSLSSSLSSAQNSINSYLSNLQSLSNGLDQLDKIYADIVNGEDFDWSSILNNDAFSDTFSKYKEEYDNFIETIANSPNDIKQCQSAFDNLVSAYLNGTGALKNLSAETRDATVAFLEQKGVVNAAEIVDYALEVQKKKLALASGECADATYAEIVQMYNEEAASNVAKAALAQLALEKINVNNAQINTASDIQQIINLANAAGASAGALEKLRQIKMMLTNIASGTAAGLRMLNSPLWDEYQKLIKGNYDFDFTPLNASNYITPVYGGGSSTRSAYNSNNSSSNNSSNSSRNTSTTSEEEKKTDEETWFEREYKAHQHKLKMEKESQAEYYKWLEWAYQKAYGEGIIELDDFRKYEEEVFEGQKALFDDLISDKEFIISGLEYDQGDDLKNANKIIAIYSDMISAVEDQIKSARDRRLTDNDDYIQTLTGKMRGYSDKVKEIIEDLFDDYINDREFDISALVFDQGETKKNSSAIMRIYKDVLAEIQKRIEKARADGVSENEKMLQDLYKQYWDWSNKITDLEKDVRDAAKDSFDELVDYRVKMLRQELDDVKESYNKRLDIIKAYYDEQKKMLQDQYDEEKYLEDQAEKRKAVFDIEAQLEAIRFDDSAWAARRRDELNQQLADAKKDLKDFERDKALELALDALDASYEKEEKTIEDMLASIENKLDNPKAIYDQALTDIKGFLSSTAKDASNLYTAMVEYNRKYGSGNDAEIAELWNNVKDDLDTFADLNGEKYNNAIIPVASELIKLNGTIGGVINASVTRLIMRAAVGLEELTEAEKQLYDLNKDGKISAEDARLAMRYSVGLTGFASGTDNASPGLHRLFENGDEYIFQSSDGSRYKVFSGGEKVLNAKATNFLYEFANGGSDIVRRLASGASEKLRGGIFKSGFSNNDIRTGDINIYGNADKMTVSEIRRAQRENMMNILKNFNHLNAY